MIPTTRATAFVARHPDRELELRRLQTLDDEFDCICADFEAAVVALQYWRAASGEQDRRVAEYAGLVGELETEILTQLDQVRPQTTDCMDSG